MSSNYIITGGRNCGKTYTALALIETLSEVEGFVSIANEAKNCYFLQSIATEEKRKVLWEGTNEPRIGRFTYDQTVFDWANQYLMTVDAKTILIDEIGRLELLGGGFAPALEKLAQDSTVTLYLCVRDCFVREVATKFKLANYTVLSGNTL
ncbi:MAG: hypothetical protein GX903_01875 [Spirochaetales bacterium]|nr:hypothetical protein [Spirochaetales bacterium]